VETPVCVAVLSAGRSRQTQLAGLLPFILMLLIDMFTSPLVGMWSIVIRISVCLLTYLKNHMSKIHKIFCMFVFEDRGLVLLCPQWNTLITPCTSVIVDDVMFSHNQATGYASQHIWCLSQATINWRVVAGRASGVKMREVGRWLVRMECCPAGLLVKSTVCSCVVTMFLMLTKWEFVKTARQSDWLSQSILSL